MDAEFVRLVNEGNFGTVERLPPNCQATHVYRREGDELVLPVKLVMENRGKRWNLDNSNFGGVLVLWLSSEGKVLVNTKDRFRTTRTRTSTIINQYKTTRDQKDIAEELHNVFDASVLSTMKEVMEFTKYKELSREFIKANRESTNKLEADAL